MFRARSHHCSSGGAAESRQPIPARFLRHSKPPAPVLGNAARQLDFHSPAADRRGPGVSQDEVRALVHCERIPDIHAGGVAREPITDQAAPLRPHNETRAGIGVVIDVGE